MNPDDKIQKAPMVPPFVRFVASAIPMVFDDSLSYYEALCALWKWLQDDVVNVINNNAAVTEDYIQLTKDMKEYMDNYFDNLDVQEEINNKLDQMAEDGTLEEIMADYIQAKVAWVFDTVSDMLDSTNLINGSYAMTLGRDAINDGGAAFYYITNVEPSVYHETIGSLYAELIVTPNGINIAAIEGDTLNDKFDNLRSYMTEYQYKKIIIPSANTNNTACYTDLSGKSSWKVDAPIILDDDYNCCEIFVNDRITATENMESVIEIAGANKPENITFTGFLEIITSDYDNITVDKGLWIKESARVLFDTVLVNYCDIGVQIGNGTSTYYATEVQATNMSVGYYKTKGIVLDSDKGLSLVCDQMQIAVPYTSATHALYSDCSNINHFYVGNLNLTSSDDNKPYGIYAINSRSSGSQNMFIHSIVSNSFNNTYDYIHLANFVVLDVDYIRVTGNVNIYCDNSSDITIKDYENFSTTSLYVKYGTANITSERNSATFTIAAGSGQNIILNGNPLYKGVIKNKIHYDADKSVSTRIDNTTEYFLTSEQSVSIDNIYPTLKNQTATSTTCTVTSAKVARIGDIKALSANITTTQVINAGNTLLVGILPTSINMCGVILGSTGQTGYKAYVEGSNLYAAESIPNGTVLRIGIVYC